MRYSEVYIGTETLALSGKTTYCRSLVELKVHGEVVLNKYYYFTQFGKAHYKFCKKYLNKIEQYEGGKNLLKMVLHQEYEYDYETENK